MYLTEQLEKKWGQVLDHKNAPSIKDPHRRAITAVMLENQQKALAEERQMLNEAAPTNSTGGAISNFDPILISLVRRALPNLLAYDICGVQPMTGPTGLIFAMRSRYTDNVGTRQASVEALFNEVNTRVSNSNQATANTNIGNGVANDPIANGVVGASNVYWSNTGQGMSTALGEALGDAAGNQFAEMQFTIEKVTVTAVTRALKAEYTLELAQDLKAIHGLDAESELANILSAEILTEINREVVRSIYSSATIGCAYGTATSGLFNLDVDSNGRWSQERFKGMIFQVEREANAIAKATRRGRGNIIIVSADVASAMAMTGVLTYTPNLKADLEVDDTGNTYAGMLHGKIKVYIDPYFGGSANGYELVTVGYKGTSPYDAGLFYCPYVPLQMVRAVGQDTFQPKIGFKTRYGMVANPFATVAADGVVGGRVQSANYANKYYRIFGVQNLM
jgi:hypothetical protein